MILRKQNSWMLLFCLLTFFLGANNKPLQGAENIPVANVIVIKKGFLKTNDPVVLSFAKKLGVDNIYEAESNPVCCVWIEPMSVDKKMTGEQFLVVHYGYTLVQVTSIFGLELFSKELDKRPASDKGTLAVGILSSFKIAKIQNVASQP